MHNQPADPLRSVHYLPRDPGAMWRVDPGVAINLAPDLGEEKLVAPNVVHRRDGGLRMYYTCLQFERDYSKAEGEIRSAVSDDGETWQREPGVRLGPHAPHATTRVLCADVVPLPDGRMRMYCEACGDDGPCHIISAVSDDGLHFTPEPGVRLGDGQWTYGSPRCLPLEDGRWRLYGHHYTSPMRGGLDAQNHIVSAISDDGLHFVPEPGVRIAQVGSMQDYAVYALEILRLGNGTFRGFYAGWSHQPLRGRIFTATSADGLSWQRDETPCVDFGGKHAELKVSEPCVIDLSDGRFRMFYEACDSEGNWRILSATAQC